jgi:hypothetical protein
MSDNNHKRRILGPKALEMIRRDVLGGLEDFAAMKAFEPQPDIMEIVSIKSPQGDDDGGEHTTDEGGAVVDLERYRSRSA